MRAALVGLLVSAGCVDIRGGAVDLAWTMFGRNGEACCPNDNFCKAAGAATVRVNLFRDVCPTEVCPAGAPDQQPRFPCPSVQAASPFNIPPGTYCIQVDAIDSGEVVVAIGPGPIVRDVIAGDVVELGAVALTLTAPTCPLTAASCPSPCP